VSLFKSCDSFDERERERRELRERDDRSEKITSGSDEAKS
jgi:hypothetical protein